MLLTLQFICYISNRTTDEGRNAPQQSKNGSKICLNLCMIVTVLQKQAISPVTEATVWMGSRLKSRFFSGFTETLHNEPTGSC